MTEQTVIRPTADSPPPTAGEELSLDVLLAGEGWKEFALCAQTDPEMFYPEKGGSTREAKKVCAECPVRAECLTWALENDERFGVWGGATERERRKLRKKP